MCYFCHVMGKNPKALDHYGEHCLDKANSYSKMPMEKRLYDNGKLITDTDDNSCAVCMTQMPTITFSPCGHVITCEECSTQVQICPMCRQKIDKRHKLILL